MRRCTILANCQGSGVAHFLRRMGFPFEIALFENYKIIKGLLRLDDATESARRCDVFLCNPTSELRHLNKSSEFFIREVIPQSAQHLIFPYLWCDAYNPLFPSPSSYVGFADIQEQLAGGSLDNVLHSYDRGNFDFKLTARLHRSLDEQRSREKQESIDVRMADWLWGARNERMMISFNHPTAFPLRQIASSIYARIVGKAAPVVPITHYNEHGLPSELPLSQYVVQEFRMHELCNPDAHRIYRLFLADAYARAHGYAGPSVNTTPYVL